MTKVQIQLVIVAILGLIVWAGYAHGQSAAPGRQNWEYRIVETQLLSSFTPASDVQQLLNQGGAEGWELIQIDEKRYFFKRRK